MPHNNPTPYGWVFARVRNSGVKLKKSSNVPQEFPEKFVWCGRAYSTKKESVCGLGNDISYLIIIK